MSRRTLLSAAIAAAIAYSASITGAAAFDALSTAAAITPSGRGRRGDQEHRRPTGASTASSKGANIQRLRRRLADQICAASGGPCVYTGRDMKSAHAGMGIQSSHFNALVQDLGKALNKFRVPGREQRELVALLAPTKKDIVTR
jgi:hypothetical protein